MSLTIRLDLPESTVQRARETANAQDDPLKGSWPIG